MPSPSSSSSSSLADAARAVLYESTSFPTARLVSSNPTRRYASTAAHSVKKFPPKNTSTKPASAGNIISSGWYGWSFSQTYCRYAQSATTYGSASPNAVVSITSAGAALSR